MSGIQEVWSVEVDGGDAVGVDAGVGVVVVASDEVLASFDLSNGNALWEVEGPSIGGTGQIDIDSDRNQLSVTDAFGHIYRFGLKDGSPRGDTPPEDPDYAFNSARLPDGFRLKQGTLSFEGIPLIEGELFTDITPPAILTVNGEAWVVGLFSNKIHVVSLDGSRSSVIPLGRPIVSAASIARDGDVVVVVGPDAVLRAFTIGL